MTVCAIVHPDGLPTLLSDVLVSIVGQKLTTPSQLGWNQGKSEELSPLMRKSFVLPQQTAAFAFSGSVERILQFTENFPLQFQNRSQGEASPMEVAGVIVDAFNSDNAWPNPSDDDRIGLLGFCRSESDGKLGINLVRDLSKQSIQTKYFKGVSAIGSGAGAVLNDIAIFDDQIDQNIALSDDVFTTSESRLNGLLGALNAKMLFVRMGDLVSDTWGGYIEATTLVDYAEFSPAESWSHLAYVTQVGASEPSIEQFGKQVHYHRSASWSGLGVRLEDRQGNVGQVSIPIEDFPASGQPNDSGVLDWSTFSPENVTLTIYFSETGMVVHRTLHHDEHKFLVQQGLMNWGLQSKFVEDICARALSVFGNAKLQE